VPVNSNEIKTWKLQMAKKKRKGKRKSPQPAGIILTLSEDKAIEHPESEKLKRIYICIGTVKFIVNQLDTRYADIKNIFLEFHHESSATDGELNPGQFNVRVNTDVGNKLIGLAWDFVDWTDRLRKVLGSAVGLDNRSQQYKDSLKLLGIASEMRNVMQHFDRNISTYVENSCPMMGAIIAFFPTATRPIGRALVGGPAKTPYHKETSMRGINMPPRVMADISSITLSLSTETVDLSESFRIITEFKAGLSPFLREQYGFEWDSKG